MSRAIGVILAALLAVQLGMAVGARRDDSPRPADPGWTPPVEVAGGAG